MRIFKTRWLTRFARKQRLRDADLADAIERAARGLVDADLGGGLIKQRIARPGQGRSAGFRALIGYKVADRAVFLFAYAKNELDNIGEDKLAELRALGAFWLNLSDQHIADSLEKQTITEVHDAKA